MNNFVQERKNKTKKRVLLGMSGGTDSSVAAMILLERGYEVMGTTLWLWDHNSGDHHCSKPPIFINEAQELAMQLGIPHQVIDAREVFQESVVQHFIQEYLQGRTPSPCIHCNPNVKWKLLLDKANEWECDYIATGHYVNIVPYKNNYYIHKGADQTKDQSYFLWNLPQEILKRTLTPLGPYTKNEVRAIAQKHGYPTLATKKESMGVCFVDNMDYRDFLRSKIPDLDSRIGRGIITDEMGNTLGHHDGYPYYTIGQKRGLELNKKDGLMVSRIVPKSNTLILDTRENLNRTTLLVSDYYFINPKDISSPKICTIVRGLGLNPQGYSRLIPKSDRLLEVILENPAWAIAPGQPVAFYIEDRLIGGGFAQ